MHLKRASEYAPESRHPCRRTGAQSPAQVKARTHACSHPPRSSSSLLMSTNFLSLKDASDVTATSSMGSTRKSTWREKQG